MMNAKCKLYLIPLILAGMSVSIASCSTASIPTQTNAFVERTSTIPAPTQTNTPTERASTAPTPTQTDVYTEGVAGLGALILRIRVNHPKQTCLQGGELLDIQFTVTNEGQNRRLEVLESKDKPVLDMVIGEHGSPELIYSWAAQNPDQVRHHVEWQPGESQTINVKWQLPQKEYAHQTLDIVGSVYVDDIRRGESALIFLCLGYPPAVNDAINPTPKVP
jgi:hypothetical protein